ncbi:MAG: HD-GYP domain-containing protein, partial [Bacillota bacterium]
NDIYRYHGEVILTKGSKLNQRLLNRIKDLGIDYIYIKSGAEFNEKIEYDDIINPKVRIDLVKKYKNAIDRFSRFIVDYKNVSRYLREIDKFEKSLDYIAKTIIRETHTNSDLSVVSIKRKNLYKYEHIIDTSIISYILGKNCDNLPYKLRYDLIITALLMDLSLFVKDDILYEKHIEISRDLAKEHTNFNARILKAILDHHEHFDSKAGFPKENKKQDISLISRIIKVAQKYDEITSTKPLKDKKLNHNHEAFEYIMGQGNREFDMEIVRIFARKMSPYSKGMYVKLSNGKKGMIYDTIKNYPLRPVIKLFKNDKVISLIKDNSITVKKVIFRKESN